MSFSTPVWLYVTVPVVLILLLLIMRGSKARRRLIQLFIADKLLPELLESYSPLRRLLKNTLIIIGTVLVIISISGPQWGYKWEEIPSKGIDVLIALDTSKSMLAQDIKPNRLRRSKFAILDLLEKLDSDRIGLIAFAGGAFLQCPLTLDHDAFRLTLENIDTSIIPRGGTDIAAAISEAEIAFDKDSSHKILILITDGEDLEERGLAKAKEVSENGVMVYTVGVGTTAGELIQITTENGQTDYARDTQGNVVKTRLEEDTLIKIAQATGGFYTPLGARGDGLLQVYEAGLSVIPKEEREDSLRKVEMLRYQWPLGIACFLLVIEIFLSTRRLFKSRKNVTASIAIPLILLVGISNDLDAEISIPEQAHQSYVSEDYEKAVELYQEAIALDPNDPTLKYNLATSLYKSGDLEKAESIMEENLNTTDVRLQDETFYNLGNTRYQRGKSLMQEDPKKTIELWEKSLEDYENAIELNPEDTDAGYNKDLVTQQLEELKKQLEQQEQQQNQEKEKQDSEDQEDSEEQEGQESQQEEGQEQEQEDGQQQEGQDGQQQDQQDGQEQDQQQEGQEGQEQSQPEEGENGEEEQQSASGEEDKEEEEGQGAQTGKEGEEDENPEESQNIQGAMSKEEARQLLDSLKNSEKKLPITNYRLYKDKRDKRSFKDW